MKIYKYLDADLDKIKLEISSYINDLSIYKIGFNKLPTDELLNISPTLSKFFVTMRCEPVISFMIRTPVGSSKKNAHVDNWVKNSFDEDYGDTGYVLAINIPVKNTEDTYTSFYEYIDGPITNLEFGSDHGSHNVQYRYYGKSNLKEIDGYFLNKPVIINTSIPHSVTNNTDKDRFVITFRFKKDPWHLFYD